MKVVNIYNDLGLVDPRDFMSAIRDKVITVLKHNYNAKVQLQLVCLMQRQLEFLYGEVFPPILTFDSNEYLHINAEQKLYNIYSEMIDRILTKWEFWTKGPCIWRLSNINRLVINIIERDDSELVIVM